MPKKKKQTGLPKELTTITPMSKMLAMFLFIALPVLAFVFGMYYQSNVYALQQTGYQEARSL